MENTAKIRNWKATASGDILDESGAVIFHRAPLSSERSFQEAKDDAQFVVTAPTLLQMAEQQMIRMADILEMYVEVVGILADLLPDDCESPERLAEIMEKIEAMANEGAEEISNAKH